MVAANPPANTTGLSTTTSVYDAAHGGSLLYQSCDSPAGGSCSSATRYTQLTYDALGRTIQSATYAGHPSGAEKVRTVTSYDADGETTTATLYQDGSGSASDALGFGYDALGRQTSVARGGSTISSAVFNPDDTMASRTDPSISATASTFSYDALGRLVSATSALYGGSLTWSWRLDGLLAGRTWLGSSNSAAATYDAAKRPTGLVESHGASVLASLGRTYDRAGRAASETQVLAGIPGAAGSGTDAFGYDALGRVVSATGVTVSGATTGARSYAYG